MRSLTCSAIYLDTSALAKLVLPAVETRALARALRDHRHLVAASIAEIELRRAAGRRGTGDALESRISEVLEAVTLVDATPAIRVAAGKVPPRALRSLDAVHLATALSLAASLISTRQAISKSMSTRIK